MTEPTTAPQPAAEGPIRDAATVILLRRSAGVPQVLMGQRGAMAAFMPSKFVFPGGALDPEDMAFADALAIDAETEQLLSVQSPPGAARALALAAIRELWEEAGLALGRPDPGAAGFVPRAPETLRSMLAAGLRPDAAGLRFIFRAVTPPGRPRRFDARFFLADAERVHGDTDDFSLACGELGCLQWVELAAARALPLPFITEIVLAEIEAIIAADGANRPVPFFHHDRFGSHIGLFGQDAQA